MLNTHFSEAAFTWQRAFYMFSGRHRHANNTPPRRRDSGLEVQRFIALIGANLYCS